MIRKFELQGDILKEKCFRLGVLFFVVEGKDMKMEIVVDLDLGKLFQIGVFDFGVLEIIFNIGRKEGNFGLF